MFASIKTVNLPQNPFNGARAVFLSVLLPFAGVEVRAGFDSAGAFLTNSPCASWEKWTKAK